MTALGAATVPVIVAIGECTERPSAPGSGSEPVALMAQALRLAEQDAGVDLLAALTDIGLVGQFTWPYRNPVDALCKCLGIAPDRQVNESFGGDTPVRAIHDAACRIAAGERVLAAVVGGEATSSLRKARQAKVPLPWTPRPSRENRFSADFSELELGAAARREEAGSPALIYPLFENAYLHRRGLSPAERSAEAAREWAAFSRVAATNPHAWSTVPVPAEEIGTVSARNRMIAAPYPKAMVANPVVNQAAAVIVTSLEWALALGVPEDRLVYLHGGAAAQEPGDFMARDRYDRSAAQQAVLASAVSLAGQPDLLELYSCFPIVPALARETLSGLGVRADIPPTVAGGLSFFGGPLNNYMSHAACAMTRKLRAGEGATGLLYGQGGVMTRHHALVLARTPPERPLAAQYSVQAEADSAREPVPPQLDRYSGPAVIETWTIQYGNAGRPLFGIVVARTPQGERVLARVRADDETSMALLSCPDRSPVGSPGHIRVDAFDHNVWEEGEARDRGSLPRRFCTVEREGHLTIVTINRPEVMNALHPLANEELVEVFDAFQADPEQWVAILTGAGERAFSAGNDLGYTAAALENGEHAVPPVKGFGGLTARWDLDKPVIAAVNGVAMGGGFEIALACDLIIAAEQAVFALPEPRVGLAALAGGLHRLPRQIGEKQAMGMILTGRRVSAAEGLAMGFVNEVAPRDDVLAVARRWAEDIMACSPMSVRASKEIGASGLAQPSLKDALARQQDSQALHALFRSHDLREGPRAFAEKRAPRWRGG